jgi:cation diffusion facilitator CzcD-associated flavoprotein CzcO
MERGVPVRMSGTLDVAIVGAGPYGLSVAAHLHARRVPAQVFGQPMQTWLPMPRSLCLKSLGFATSIAVPEPGHEFPTWLARRGLETREPISYAHFTEYGLWVQRQVVPDVQPVDVTTVRQTTGGEYALELASGQELRARKVVVAVGLHGLEQLPDQLAGFPEALVSHSFGQYDFRRFAGQEVAVLGAGQSALEAAVLLHETGAQPLLVARRSPVFHGRTRLQRSWLERRRAPLTVLGEGRLSWVLEHFPWVARHAPEARRVRFARSYLGPAGAWWLRDRLEGKVSVLAPATVVEARARSGSVVLRIAVDGRMEERSFAHVVCGTGFRHSLDGLSFLEPRLLAKVDRIAGLAPRLSRHFESAVPGLYFVGPLSAYSFGPLFRFVCGAVPTAPVVARHLATAARRVPRAAGRRAEGGAGEIEAA